MADSLTIARPYAKAAFVQALESNALHHWSADLNKLADLMLQTELSEFIANPASTTDQQVKLLMSLVKTSDDEYLRNFISTLAENRRLTVLTQIRDLFEELRAEQEKIVSIDVISYDKLSSTQEQELISSLSRRLQRQVTLNVSIDKDLIGGAVIKAGDLVIDGSVRGKLNKLSVNLVA